MTPIAHHLTRLARELNCIDSENEVCKECHGNGCPGCDGFGAFPVSAIQAGRNKRPANPYSRQAMDRRNGSRGI